MAKIEKSVLCSGKSVILISQHINQISIQNTEFLVWGPKQAKYLLQINFQPIIYCRWFSDCGDDIESRAEYLRAQLAIRRRTIRLIGHNLPARLGLRWSISAAYWSPTWAICFFGLLDPRVIHFQIALHFGTGTAAKRNPSANQLQISHLIQKFFFNFTCAFTKLFYFFLTLFWWPQRMSW